MKICFKAGRKTIRFVAKPRRCKTPTHLKKFLFKAGTKRLQAIQVKARKGYRVWKRSSK